MIGGTQFEYKRIQTQSYNIRKQKRQRQDEKKVAHLEYKSSAFKYRKEKET